jgi:hypothetical protein
MNSFNAQKMTKMMGCPSALMAVALDLPVRTCLAILCSWNQQEAMLKATLLLKQSKHFCWMIRLKASYKSSYRCLVHDTFLPVVAENMKVSGNEALKHGIRGAHDAIAFYDKAIACNSTIAINVSNYYGNRAQANL